MATSNPFLTAVRNAQGNKPKTSTANTSAAFKPVGKVANPFTQSVRSAQGSKAFHINQSKLKPSSTKKEVVDTQKGDLFSYLGGKLRLGISNLKPMFQSGFGTFLDESAKEVGAERTSANYAKAVKDLEREIKEGVAFKFVGKGFSSKLEKVKLTDAELQRKRNSLAKLKKTSSQVTKRAQEQVTSGETFKARGVESAKKVAAKRAEFTESTPQPDKWSGKWLAGEVLENTPQLVASLGLGITTAAVTKNPSLALAVGFQSSYVQEAGGAYNEAKQAGLSESQAQDVANATGTINALIEQIPLGGAISKNPALKKSFLGNLKRVVINTTRQSAAEGGTESTQELVSNALKLTYDENQDLFEGVLESGVIGALLGGGSSIFQVSADGSLSEDPSAVANIEVLNPDAINKLESTVLNAFQTPKDKRSIQQQEIVDVYANRVITPTEARNLIIGDEKLTSSPVGQAILKSSIRAQETQQNLQLSLDESTGKLTVELVEDTSTLDAVKKTFEDALAPTAPTQDITEDINTDTSAITEVKEEDIQGTYDEGVYPMQNKDKWYGDADYKTRGGKLVTMSPDMFLSQSKPLKIDDTARENIDELKQLIQDGTRLDPLALYSLDISDVRNSDGRHRAIAAKELGLNKVPVLSFVDGKSTTLEAEEYQRVTGGKDSKDLNNKITFSSEGDFADVEVKFGGMEDIQPMEFPELIRLAKDLIGAEEVNPRTLKDTKNGTFTADGNGRIALNRKLFEEGNFDQLTKTLAHEIGHLIDYLPEQILRRGNLFGHLSSLRKFLRHSFSDVKTEARIDELVAKKKELQKQRKDIKGDGSLTKVAKAKKDKPVLQELSKVNKEIRTLQKDAIKLKPLKQELVAFSELWRPYDKTRVDEDFIAYRESSEELYADAVSGLLVNPQVFLEKAPTFYDAFFANLDQKPKVKEAYFAIQDLLQSGEDAVLERRLKSKYEGYAKARAKRREIENRPYDKPSWKTRFMTQHVTRFHPIYDKLNKAIKEKGLSVSAKEDARIKLETMQYVQNDQYLYIDKLHNDIIAPLTNVGVSEDQFGAILELERNLTGRKEIANPDGLSEGYAQKTLDKLREQFTSSQVQVIDKVMKEFREENFKWTKRLYKTGRISEEVWNDVINPNKENYATFQVVKYISDNFVSAGIKKATGTLSQVENPVTSTALKTLEVIQETLELEARNFVVETHKTTFPEDIELAKKNTVKGVDVGFKHQHGKGVLEVYRDGKREGYYVDPYIVEMFKKYPKDDMHSLVRASAKFNSIFKPLVTTYNLSWGLYSNIIRDSTRTYKNLASILPDFSTGYRFKGVSEYITTWIKAIPEGAKFQRAELTALTKEMLENKAFGIPFAEFDPNANEDSNLAPVLRKYGYAASKKELSNKTVAKFIEYPAKLLRGIEFIGGTLESTSKVAAYQITKKRITNAEKAGFIVRNYTGTPNYNDGGTQKQIDNNVFVFSNVMIQSLRSEYEISTDPNTRAGWWYRTFALNIAPKLMMLAAASGLLGEELKDGMDKATEYDKTNYLVVPLGEDENGKAIYWRIPQDETGRFLSAIAWKTGSYFNGTLAKPQQILDITANYFIPSTTPLWNIVGGWLAYVSGRNPYDEYRGRGVIDQTTFTAGGIPALKTMVKWTLNESGIANFDTYDPARESTFEARLQSLPVINRAIKVSDYGLTEQDRQATNTLDRDNARHLLNEREILNKYVEKGRKLPIDEALDLTGGLVREAYPKEKLDSKSKTRIQNLVKKYHINLVRGKATRELEGLIDAGSNAEKELLLERYRERLTNKEMQELVSIALQYKVISKSVKLPK